jgi:hypothetical protein
VKAVNMPIYDNGVQVWGAEPNKPAVNAIIGGSGTTKEISVCRITCNGEYLSVEGGHQQILKIFLISADGRMVFSTSSLNNHKISLKKIKSGVYVLILSDKSNQVIERQSIVIHH